MKKFLSILLAVIMTASLLSLASCSAEKASVGVQNGTTGFFYVKGDADWGFDGFENLEAKGYENGALAVSDMLNGNNSCVVIDKDVALSLVANNSGTKVIDYALTTEKYGIAVNKGKPELLAEINKILAENKEAIAEIVERHAKFSTENADSSTWDGVTIKSAKLAEDEAGREGQLVVATNAEFPPFEFKIGDEFAGIDMEIAKLIADKLGKELVIVHMEFDSILMNIEAGYSDIGLAAMTKNPDREKQVTFSDDYHSAAQVVITTEDDKSFDNCKSAEDVVEVLKSLEG